MKRRGFIKNMSRWLLLSGLLGTTGFLAYRRQFGNPDNCVQNPFCSSCGQISSCEIVAKLNSTKDEGPKR